MSLNVGKVWLLREEQEILVPAKQIEPEDLVVVRMGNVIPVSYTHLNRKDGMRSSCWSAMRKYWSS